MNFLSFDVGTTNCKCQLFSSAGEIITEYSAEYGFRTREGQTYVDIAGIWEQVKAMIARVAKSHEINSICISSFGESFVLLGDGDEILFDPMLYTDPRGEEEAEEISRCFSEEFLFSTTGVLPQSMYSISKLLWIQSHHPDLFVKAKKAMLICDYLGYLLTGERVIDYALASRTGVFDINALRFNEEILTAFGISASIFSKPRPTGSVVGKIKECLCRELGVGRDCALVLGSHDQICSALGAGALRDGDAVDGMGTVECITALFSKKPSDPEMGKQGYVCVPYAVQGLYCTYMFNYSCGSLVNWFRKKILHGYAGDGDNFFEYIERQMPKNPSSVLVLPYFSGAATPYMDIDATGGIFNLTTATTDGELYRAILEGCAMEMKLNMQTAERYGVYVKRAVATGGGANSRMWLQIKADIQEISIRTLRSSEGGLCGCALLQAVAMGQANSLEEAAKIFVRYDKGAESKESERYLTSYQKYKKLYRMIKEIK